MARDAAAPVKPHPPQQDRVSHVCTELKCAKWHDAQSPGRADEPARAEEDMVVVGDETARGQLKPFEDARPPRSRGEATPPGLLRPRRNDEDNVGIVTFDMVEDAVDLMKVGEHVVDLAGPALGEGVDGLGLR